ncbi:GPI-anchored wall transfer protein 1 [Saccharata proteae CBS 121410]|uniref:GPI-anchored wall transfer protein n=1 Tax=Saccharata proteae CBS 121410 TaxID=1314787 RepID=A0A9P4LZD1_9PEZI|nr:GPI-anchored wall transfer protein 1 [Saccharata proteae CBS 121410]
MPQSYKAMKEAFVSNLSGSTISEINAVTLVAPSAVLLWSVLQSRHSFFNPYTPAACLTDVLLNALAILLATTLYSYSPLLLNVLLVGHSIFAFYSSAPANARGQPHAPPARSSAELLPKDPLPLKPFVTAWRGAMMVITCVAILAVDFKVFPRRFAKVETWGTSLMDLGVGSFVFSAGVVSARTLLKQQTGGLSPSLVARLRDSMRHSIPLLVLGLIRLYSVKGLDYAEHVTEYGVHWNFFFTLGFLPPFVALFEAAFRFIPSFAALALMLGVGYEVALNSTDLLAYVLTAERVDLISQNREGIFSFFGYLAIFLAGRSAGMYVLRREPHAPEIPRSASFWQKSRVILHTSILAKLVLWTVIWSALLAWSTSYYGGQLRVSRRLANLPYFLWVSAFNCGQLALFCAIETIFFPDLYKARDNETERQRCREATSKVLNAFNRNGLAVFLLANLLTGAVNLTLKTLLMGQVQAMAVLVAYTGVLSAVALVLDRYDISVKL